MVVELTFLFLFVFLLIIVMMYAIYRLDIKKRQKPKKLKNKGQKKIKTIKYKNQKLELWITRKDNNSYYYIYELNGVEFKELNVSKKSYKNQTLEEIQKDLLEKFKADINKIIKNYKIKNMRVASEFQGSIQELERLEYSEEYINWVIKNIL